MKKLTMVLFGCMAVSLAWGRSFSIDLRQTATRNGVRAVAQRRSSPSATDSGFLHCVNLDAGSADVGQVAVGDELSFTLFDDVSITLTLKKQMQSPLGGDVFLAEASGYEGVKNAVVLRTADGLTVDIQDYLNKKVYKVISTETGVAVQELEAKAVKCGCDTRVPPSLAGKATVKAHKAKKVVAAKDTVPGETCVDILVAYDQNAVLWAKLNGGGVTNFAQMAVQRMNTALANNGLDVDFRFRLVGVHEVAASSADLDYTLDAVTDGSGNWTSVKMKRDEVGADIVTVLIDTGTDEGTTGLGWSLESEEEFEAFSAYAYNVCAIRSVAQSHTMTHEVGHNMGCGHSDVQATQPGPQLYPYSSAYYFSVDGDKYHTIMAYDGEGPGGSEIPYFSSPLYYYRGVAVGDAKHDNRSTLLHTYSAVSKWRAESGIDIDGNEDVPTAPLEWLTSRNEVFAKAKSEGKNVFLISGRDTCSNTMGTRNYSCEDPSVKRHLLQHYVCWYNVIDTQSEESDKYFDGYDVGSTLPFIAIIDANKDETLAAEGGYHSVTDLRVMLGRVAKEVSFSPESGSRFRDSVEVTLSAASGTVIFYTLDGSDPSAGSSVCYDKPITLTSTTTIRAVTFADGVWGLPVAAVFSKTRTEKYGDYEWTADVVDDGCVIVSVKPEPTGDVSIPDDIEGVGVKGFDAKLFKENANLTTIAIPGGVSEIPESAFESCEELRAVTIGAGVERIGAYAFNGAALETISIPASVTDIDALAFMGCNDMTAVTVDSANGRYSSKDGFMYDKTLKHLLYGPGSLRYVEIPQGVTHIGANAFRGSNIERVVFPKTLVEIGDYAFMRCGQLKEVAIPESVTTIGYSAFDNCWAPLTDAYLPKHLESADIQYNSFYSGRTDMEVALHYYSGVLNQVAVCFDANGGELENPNQTLEIVGGAIVVPSALPVPIREGRTFLGWFTAAEGGTQVTVNTVVADDTTLYAHWTPSDPTTPTPEPTPAQTIYAVTFNANGGSVSPTTRTVNSGAAIGTLPTPTRSGYTFDGWFTAANGGTQVAASTVVTGDVTYYAHWTEIPVPISEPDSESEPDTTTTDVEDEVTYAGVLNPAFTKAQTVDGALYKGDALVGTVQVKVGKVNKKGVVKVSGTATMLIDGKAKKVTAKAVNVMLDATERVPPVKVVFKAPIGEMAFEMAADGSFTLKNGSYLMVEAKIGGAINGGEDGTFSIEDFNFSVPGILLDELLPDGEPFEVSRGKWKFAKAATVKLAKPKKGAELSDYYDDASGKDLIVDDSKGKTNLSGLKLTYTAKTGQFKGSFKVYALQGTGKKRKLAKYTVNVIGFVVDGVGYGQATCKKPAGTWTVTVE